MEVLFVVPWSFWKVLVMMNNSVLHMCCIWLLLQVIVYSSYYVNLHLCSLTGFLFF